MQGCGPQKAMPQPRSCVFPRRLCTAPYKHRNTASALEMKPRWAVNPMPLGVLGWFGVYTILVLGWLQDWKGLLCLDRLQTCDPHPLGPQLESLLMFP